VRVRRISLPMAFEKRCETGASPAGGHSRYPIGHHKGCHAESPSYRISVYEYSAKNTISDWHNRVRGSW